MKMIDQKKARHSAFEQARQQAPARRVSARRCSLLPADDSARRRADRFPRRSMSFRRAARRRQLGQYRQAERLPARIT